jgi:hypothetical protein
MSNVIIHVVWKMIHVSGPSVRPYIFPYIFYEKKGNREENIRGNITELGI